MSRWDYDTVFYRVFCITLLAVAFTFTVILTNVFVDIDGLLSKKDKATTLKPETELIPNGLAELSDVINVNMIPDDKPEDEYEDKDYQESNDLYRSKRSLDTHERLFHIRDPKVKKLLTNHLANLLDELDEEESITSVKRYNEDSATDGKDNKKANKKLPQNIEMRKTSDKNVEEVKKEPNSIKHESEEVIENLKENKGELKYKKDEMENTLAVNNDEMLHLAMHNIILQGVKGSMKLDDVYKKVADLVMHVQNNHSNVNDGLKILFKETYSKKPKEETEEETPIDNSLNVIESVKETDVENTKKGTTHDDNNDVKLRNKKIVKATDNNIIIKTIIDITDMSNDKPNKEGTYKSKDKINGIVKLIYNGNVIKFKRIDDENDTIRQNLTNLKANKKLQHKNIQNSNKTSSSKTKTYKSNQRYLNNVIHEYLEQFQRESDSSEHEKVYSKKRLKRHVKIRFENDKQDKTTTAKPKSKKEDDELFVEIETHFDSKGTKGEKKKKLIRDLIKKIQNAIHSDKDDKKKKPKHWHVKKRIQNPLNSKNAAALLNKLILPLETLAKRHLDPISKVVTIHEQVPLVADVFGRNHWHKTFQGPKFLNKAINSAEMNTVDTDYSKVMSHNGIPQRLQKPLHSDISDEVFQDSSVVELGNIKFLMKDIDGTGFSIGFNQYTDEAPDPETMKLFSGLQNIIQTYHQKYDEESTDTQQQENYDNTQKSSDVDENQEQMDRSDQHLIQRRSIKDSDQCDHHTNRYRIVYSHNYLPYDNYQEIFETNKGHLSNAKSMKMYTTKLAKKSTLFIDDNVFNKVLKPAEILSIADLFQRRKRSLQVKKMSNIKIKNKSNRKFLNTNRMASQNFIRNKKRNKRQIDKIRIIARELPQTRKHSEEDIFVVSDEKIFADRALLKEAEVPEIPQNENLPSVEHYDIISSNKKEDDPFDTIPKEAEDHFDIVSPYLYEVSPIETQNEFTRLARHNSLMSKYPHILMGETQRSLDPAEDTFPENAYSNNYYIETSTKTTIPPLLDTPMIPDEKDIVELKAPPKDNNNYKISVKIRPKNATGMSGFKEVHTSINKSYNKNGLMYTSLVNVTQLSKVEKINKSVSRREFDRKDFDHSSIMSIKQLQELMKSLVRQHTNRLDHQLKQLKMEKDKLDSIIVGNTETVPESANVASPNIRLQLTQGQTRKLLGNIPKETTEVSAQSIATKPTTSTMTTQYVQPISDDIMKTKMISSIERNENVTNELLKKIDQNTDVLKTFLGKLIANMEVTTKATVTESKNDNTNKENEERLSNKNELNRNMFQTKQPSMGNNHMPFNFEDYYQHIPNLIFRTEQRPANNTIGIPFVYAYQRPYSMVANKETPMASVVYHGHIHTDTMYNDKKRENKFENKSVLKPKEQNLVNENKRTEEEFWKPKPGEKVLHNFVLQNNTKFFLEQPENSFKVVPFNDESKRAYNSVGINATHV